MEGVSYESIDTRMDRSSLNLAPIIIAHFSLLAYGLFSKTIRGIGQLGSGVIVYYPTTVNSGDPKGPE